MNEDIQSSEYDYYLGRKSDRTYISKPFKALDLETSNKSNMRFAYKVIDNNEIIAEAILKGDLILRLTHNGRQEIRAKIFEDTRRITSLTIQRFTKQSGKPHKTYFSFSGKEIAKLIDFIKSIKIVDLDQPNKIRIDDELLKNQLSDREGILIEVATSKITKKDIVAVAYRKSQLEEFRKLIEEDEHFQLRKKEWAKKRDEDVWQYFFEKNKWIFGYGLNYVFNEPLQGKKLEQVTVGSDIKHIGKRADALLKTRGFISSLCLVEIKTPSTELLKPLKNPYRSGCWEASSELSGGVIQSQQTNHKTLNNISPKLETTLDDGDPTGESIYSFAPKSYLIVGSLSQFVAEKGINIQKYSSFELFRRNIHCPEIITFDELFERAKFIVQSSETSNPNMAENSKRLREVGDNEEASKLEKDINIEDIPF